jgi:hypothetical protein
MWDVGLHQSGISDLKYATCYRGDSTTAVTIAGSGNVGPFTVSAQGLPAGTKVRAYSKADSSKFMQGTVYSYSGSTLYITVLSSGGSGTPSDWTIGEVVESKGCEGLALANNEFFRNNFDVYLNGNSFNTLATNNTFAMSFGGAVVEVNGEVGGSNLFSNNWFDSCLQSDSHIVRLYSSDNGFINNTVSASPAEGHVQYRGGIVVYGYRNRIIGNGFGVYGLDSTGHACPLATGIYVYASNNSLVMGNSFNNPLRSGESGYFDIVLGGSSCHNQIGQNICTNGETGRITLQAGSSYNGVLGNIAGTVSDSGTSNEIAHGVSI